MLTQNAQKIFDDKYARTLPSGNKETWEQACVRVAHHVAQAEQTESNRLQYTADFTKILVELSFLPGGRVLSNAGTEIKNMMNCFVLPIEDSRDGIYTALRYSAEIFAHGGGIGYNFSNLRGAGTPVKGTGASASGPLSFMELFDHTGEVIAQGSRRGAQMGILNIDHPDIEAFIQLKNKLHAKNQRMLDEYSELTDRYDPRLERVLANNQFTHFNISVALTDEYMINPDYKLYLIGKNAWENGDPGVYFIDRANADNMVPYLGSLDATNPCGEVPLLAYEPCCLGSINLERFVAGKFIDFDYLKFVVRTAVRFLDNVQELNETPVEKINGAARATRRLGLGVMGFADFLAELQIPYDHEDALTAAQICGKILQMAAWEASMELAAEKGAFPTYDAEKMNWRLIDNLGLERKPIRNVAVTSVAPTGSIALVASVNGGIEPHFSKNYTRHITKGIGNSAVASISQQSIDNSSVRYAHQIGWQDHVKMQAAWQEHVDNAVSKTINMPNDASIEEIVDSYKLAWELGCKGITVYRDNSRGFQVLNRQETE